MRLENKVALVTGASRGIGRDIAIGFAREGADVVVNSFEDRERMEDTAEEARAFGRQALCCDADVSEAESVKGMAAAAIEEFGRIDILVNNAGIALWKPFLEITEEIWDRTLDVNLKGVFLCSQVVARDMVKRGEGGRFHWTNGQME